MPRCFDSRFFCRHPSHRGSPVSAVFRLSLPPTPPDCDGSSTCSWPADLIFNCSKYCEHCVHFYCTGFLPFLSTAAAAAGDDYAASVCPPWRLLCTSHCFCCLCRHSLSDCCLLEHTHSLRFPSSASPLTLLLLTGRLAVKDLLLYMSLEASVTTDYSRRRDDAIETRSRSFVTVTTTDCEWECCSVFELQSALKCFPFCCNTIFVKVKFTRGAVAVT